MKEEKMSTGKSLIVTLVVIVIIAGVILLMNALKIPMWIPFLGLTAWSTIGMPMDMKSIVSLWLSATVALFTGYLLGNAETLGVAALAVAAICLFLLIFGIVSGKLSIVFNMVTAIFITVATIQGVVIEVGPAIKGLLFGFVLFGLIPSLVVSSMAKKKQA